MAFGGEGLADRGPWSIYLAARASRVNFARILIFSGPRFFHRGFFVDFWPCRAKLGKARNQRKINGERIVGRRGSKSTRNSFC
jgi:hypothetical protein